MSHKIKGIKIIFFDADDTLIDHKECEKQALKYLFDNIGIEFKKDYQDIFRPLDEKLWDSVATGTSIVPREEIPTYRFKNFFNLLNIEYNEYDKVNELFQDGLSKSVALLDGAEEIVKYLYDKGYQICVVTNGLIKLQKPRVLNSNISKYISDVIVSEEVGEFKPNPKIFNVLLERLNIASNEVIMIGDSLKKDILGAKNANIKNIWYNPEYEKNLTGILPDYEINILEKIKKIL